VPAAGHVESGVAEPAQRHLVTKREGVRKMIGILIAVLVAALVWAICVALGLPAIVGIVAAILVLLAGIPSGGYGLGSRFGGAGRRY
jgi:hypothetical protein